MKLRRERKKWLFVDVNNFKKLQDYEQKYIDCLANVKNEIISEINNFHSKTIKSNRDSCFCFVVNYSIIAKNNWSLNHLDYDIERQKKIIIEKIVSFDTIDSIVGFLEKCVSSKSIVSKGTKINIETDCLKKIEGLVNEIKVNMEG